MDGHSLFHSIPDNSEHCFYTTFFKSLWTVCRSILHSHRVIEGNGLHDDGMQKSLIALSLHTKLESISHDFLLFLCAYAGGTLISSDSWSCLERHWFSSAHFETKQCSFSGGFSDSRFSTGVFLGLNLLYCWRPTRHYVASFPLMHSFCWRTLHVCCARMLSHILCQSASDWCIP